MEEIKTNFRAIAIEATKNKKKLFKKMGWRFNHKITPGDIKIMLEVYKQDEKFNNGDRVYIGEKFVGRWVGIKPESFSHVVYNTNTGEYKGYHEWQVNKYKSLST